MEKKIRIILIFTIFISLSLFLTGCKKTNGDEEKITIISTSFPGYDFARAITKDSKDINVKMLLKPGAETHDYEPSPKDILSIKNSDLFIYVGGESDEWISEILNDIDFNQTKIIKLMDLVETKNEEIIDGMETDKEDDEPDEHVWTSPINAIKIVDSLSEEIKNIDKTNESLYKKNTDDYILELYNIDSEIRDVVNNSKRKEIIFGDRFPFRYFTDEYGLNYYAAFPGCSDASEASAKTIAFLINKIKEDELPVIFRIELSNGKIANAISNETGVKVLEFNSAHNISQNDFDNGITYIDIMKNNIKVLKEALN